MNKKGFTLIELLAVIVVLAIIALIATPIVMRLISDVQEGADARSVEGYMKAYEGAYYNYMLKNGGRIPTETLELTKSDYSGVTVICEGITVIDGKFTAICSVEGHDGRYKYENGHAIKIDNERVEGSTPDSPSTPSGPGETEEKLCSLVEGFTAGAVGAQYTCNLGDGNRVFYILENKTDSTEVTLILDRNYDDTTQAWCDQQGSQPDHGSCKADGLTSKLNAIRTAWSSLDAEKITLPTYAQIYNVNNDIYYGTATWLKGNLDKDSSTPFVQGYWTATITKLYNSFVYVVTTQAYIEDARVNVTSKYGVRPVITVSKSAVLDNE